MKSLDKEISLTQLLKQLKSVEAKIKQLQTKAKGKKQTVQKSNKIAKKSRPVVKKRTVKKSTPNRKKRIDSSDKAILRSKAPNKPVGKKSTLTNTIPLPRGKSARFGGKSGGKTGEKSSVNPPSAKRPELHRSPTIGKGRMHTLTIDQYDKRLKDGRLSNDGGRMKIRVHRSQLEYLQQKAKDTPREQQFLWYVISVNMNFLDKKVRRTLTQKKKEEGLDKLIKNVKLLRYQSHETRNGMPVTFSRARFPGYLFVQCKMTPEVQSFIQTHKGVFCILMNPNNLQSADSLHMAQLILEQANDNKKKRIAQNKINPIVEASEKMEKQQAQTAITEPKESEEASLPKTKYQVGENVIVNIPPDGPWHGMEGTIVRIDEGRYFLEIKTKLMGETLVVRPEFPEHHLVSIKR